MSKQTFDFTVAVDDRSGRVMAAYFQLRKGKVAETREVSEGKAFADYDEEGSLLGIELLAPCSVTVLDSIAEREPEEVKKFLRRVSPREMVVA